MAPSENPRSLISKAEVFCGSTLSKRGVQSRRQREASIRLKKVIDRSTMWISKLIRGGTNQGGDSVTNLGSESDASESDKHRALQSCWVCLVVGCAAAADGVKASNCGALDARTFSRRCCNLLAATRSKKSSPSSISGLRTRLVIVARWVENIGIESQYLSTALLSCLRCLGFGHQYVGQNRIHHN